jgi:hypothetical protein
MRHAAHSSDWPTDKGEKMNEPELLRETLYRVGFRGHDCKSTRYYGRLLCDPVIAALKDAAFKKRPGHPGGSSRCTFPGDESSVEFITKCMTASELSELHERILTWPINSSTGLTESPLS